jgi:hypothetical protein
MRRISVLSPFIFNEWQLILHGTDTGLHASDGGSRITGVTCEQKLRVIGVKMVGYALLTQECAE